MMEKWKNILLTIVAVAELVIPFGILYYFQTREEEHRFASDDQEKVDTIPSVPDDTIQEYRSPVKRDHVILDAQSCIHLRDYCLGRSVSEYRVVMYLDTAQLTSCDYQYTCGACVSDEEAIELDRIAKQHDCYGNANDE